MKLLAITSFALLFLFHSASVLACTPSGNYIALLCTANDVLSDDEIPKGISYYNGKLSLSSGYLYELSDSNFDFLVSNCQEDVASIKSDLMRLFTEYEAEQHGPFTHERTEIMPYDALSVEKSKSGRYDPENIGYCYFENVYRLGDFMVNEGGMREYCHLTGGGGGMCPHAAKSHTQFLKFLLANPNMKALPYLFGYLFTLTLIIGFTGYLIRRKEIILFFKPNKFNLIGTLVLVVPTLIFFAWFGGVESLLFTIIVWYILISLIKYVYDRSKK